MNKRHLYIMVLSFIAFSTVKAQFSSSFGQSGFRSPFGNSKSKSGGLQGFTGSIGNSSSISKSASSGYEAKTSGNSFGGRGSSISSGSFGHSFSGNSATSHGASRGAQATPVTQATLKNIANTRTYPGVSRSKIYSSLKGGTRYSYPGIHNMRWDIDKLKKQSQNSSGSK